MTADLARTPQLNIRKFYQVLGMLALFFISYSTRAANLTTPKDSPEFRLDIGGAMEHVPVHNQLYIGDCYAHVAAQIYDAWRFTHHDPRYEKRSSGFEINQRYKIDTDNPDITDGGVMVKVISLLTEDGSCDEGALESKLNGITVDRYASDLMGIYNTHRDSFQGLLRQSSEIRSSHPALALSSLHLAAAKQSELEQSLKELEDYQSKNVVVPYDFTRLKRIQANQSTVSIFETIGLIQCGGEQEDPRIRLLEPNALRMKNISFRNWPESSLFSKVEIRHKILNTIHHELDYGLSEAMPIGIGYCSDLLKQGYGFDLKSIQDKDCSRHESIVMGRRIKAGKRELLLRNTWGTSCNQMGYRDHKREYNSDWECDHGNLWMEESHLADAIYEVQTLVR